MTTSRRAFLAACAGAAPALAATMSRADDESARASSMGVVIHSYPNHSAADRGRDGKGGFDDPLNFVEYVHKQGGGGVQTILGVRDQEYCSRLREAVQNRGMYLEASIRVPRNPTQVDRYFAEVQTAIASGATVLRTVLLGGRRYEVLDSAEAYRKFTAEAFAALQLASGPLPGDARLAIENHKDFRAAELVEMLKRLNNPRIGVCVDFGNNIALLEDPMEVVETLAPWAYSVHIKDMAVEADEDGFLLSEVPLGEGFLDLPRMVRVLRQARPEIRFSLEMITRDPLKVPCLTPRYWAPCDDIPGRDLARTLNLVRSHKPKKPLPRVSNLSRDERLKVEDENVTRSLAYAREHLGL
jgi:sugar phosphate isomerase/epimerase